MCVCVCVCLVFVAAAAAECVFVFCSSSSILLSSLFALFLLLSFHSLAVSVPNNKMSLPSLTMATTTETSIQLLVELAQLTAEISLCSMEFIRLMLSFDEVGSFFSFFFCVSARVYMCIDCGIDTRARKSVCSFGHTHKLTHSRSLSCSCSLSHSICHQMHVYFCDSKFYTYHTVADDNNVVYAIYCYYHYYAHAFASAENRVVFFYPLF